MLYPDLYEIEFPEGLRFAVETELRKFADSIKIQGWIGKNAVQLFTKKAFIQNLLTLKSVTSIYRLISFQIPRPKALLGHQHLQILFQTIEECMNITQRSFYHSVHISAAGSDTTVMRRIHTEIATHFRLETNFDEGDLWIRIRRTRSSESGWEVLVRITPRPIATRDWRVCNFQGALSAPVAFAMMLLTKPETQGNFLNIACGSGTILIERAGYQQDNNIFGCDIDSYALDCARSNIAASKTCDTVQIFQADMQDLPFPNRSIHAICADLPFGQLVGDHKTNHSLYPQTLGEIARIATDQARFVLITHEIRLMAKILKEDQFWLLKEEYPINLNGLHPRIYVLERK